MAANDGEEDVIVPPPDLQVFIATTAFHVNKKGPMGAAFEVQIREKQKGNPRFDFLKPSSPYHGWYRQKVKEASEGRDVRAEAEKGAYQQAPDEDDEDGEDGEEDGDAAEKESDEPAEVEKSLVEELKALRLEYMQPKAELIKKPADADAVHAVKPPQMIQAIDVDIIKLTAQFVAKNGGPFLESLRNRERLNRQFHFLKPASSYFRYFSGLVDSYRAILLPPDEVIENLKKRVASDSLRLHTLIGYAEHHKQLRERVEQQRRERLDERTESLLIDWNDCVILETIDFTPGDDQFLPEPVDTIEQINASLDAEKHLEANALAAEEDQEMELESDDESEEEEEEESDEDEDGEESGAEAEAGVAAGEAEGGEKEGEEDDDAMEVGDSDDEDEEPAVQPLVERAKIQTAADVAAVPTLETAEERAAREEREREAKVSKRSNLDFQKCQLCGEFIPIADLQEHIRIELLDPQYAEQKERAAEKLRATALAANLDITEALRDFNTIRRKGVRETNEEEAQPNKVIWDGHSNSIRSVTTMIANKAMAERKQELEGGAKRVPIDTNLLASKLPPPGKTIPQPLRPHLSTAPTPSNVTMPPSSRSAASSSSSQQQQSGAGTSAPAARAQPAIHPSRLGLVPGTSNAAPRQPPPQRVMPLNPALRMPRMQPGFVQPAIIPLGRPQAPHFPPPMGVPMPAHLGGMPPMPAGQPPLQPPPAGGMFANMMPPAPGGMPPPGHPPPPMNPADMPAAKRMRPNQPQPPMPQQPPPPGGAAPPPGEIANLIPEDVFMRNHPPNVVVQVVVPHDAARGEWNFNGQILRIPMQITNTISDLKQHLERHLGGMPTKKQKLRMLGGSFVKDNSTLAYYNVTNAVQFEVGVKARGGRR